MADIRKVREFLSRESDPDDDDDFDDDDPDATPMEPEDGPEYADDFWSEEMAADYADLGGES